MKVYRYNCFSMIFSNTFRSFYKKSHKSRFLVSMYRKGVYFSKRFVFKASLVKYDIHHLYENVYLLLFLTDSCKKDR